jgi:uncharacterized repeat protein (TIGR01451 family)
VKAACAVVTPVQSFTAIKTVDASAVKAGSIVRYTVTLTNTGQVDYLGADAGTEATFTDDLSRVLDDATLNPGSSAGVTITGSRLSWAGQLLRGEVVHVTYSVTVHNPTSGDFLLANGVTTPPEGGCSVSEGVSGCQVQTAIQAYTVTKTSDTTTAKAGSDVTYAITVTNTGRIAYADNDVATFEDDLSDVLDDAHIDESSISNGAVLEGTTLNWAGDLPVNTSITVTYTVKVDRPSAGDQLLRNVVVSNSEGGCQPGVPNLACETTTPVQSMKVVKTAALPVGDASAPAEPASTEPAAGDIAPAPADQRLVVKAGGVLTYSVAVSNTGRVAYSALSPATFTDDLKDVLDDATFNPSESSPGITLEGTVLSWRGELPVTSAPVIVSYSVTVNNPDLGDAVLSNAVVTPGEGNCQVASADPDCAVESLVQSFVVTKVSNVSTVMAGSQVIYTVAVSNTSKVAYTVDAPASFTDDLTAVLTQAKYNNDATGGASFDGAVISWRGALAVGQTVVVTYSVTTNSTGSAGSGGGRTLVNVVVTPGDGTCAVAVPSAATEPATEPAATAAEAQAACRVDLAIKNLPLPVVSA